MLLPYRAVLAIVAHSFSWQNDAAHWGLAIAVLALVLGVAMVMLNELGRRPTLSFRAPSDNGNWKARGLRIWHIPVHNARSSRFFRWVKRDTSDDLEVTLEFFLNGSTAMQPVFTAIWAEQPQPLRHDEIALAHRGRIPPGRKWHAVAVFKINEQAECHPLQEDNYLISAGSLSIIKPREMGPGAHSIRACLGTEEHQTRWYRIDNPGITLDDFMLSGPFKENPLS